jgi:hypothetical protein
VNPTRYLRSSDSILAGKWGWAPQKQERSHFDVMNSYGA